MTHKKPKASHGSGSVEQVAKLPDGRLKWKWRIRATMPDGTPKRIAGTFIGTKAEATRVMQAAKLKAESAGITSNPDLTISALLEAWLTAKANQVSSRTISIYRQVGRHITQEGTGMGALKVRAVTAAHVQAFYERLEATGLERTREQVHGVLKQALDHAVRQGVLPSNPVASATKPRARSTRRKVLERKGETLAWTQEEASALLQQAMLDADPMSWAVAFALHTGLRRGEVLGLTWKHVDLKTGRIQIVQALTLDDGERRVSDPKTNESNREVPLNAAALAILETVKAWQKGEAHREGWQRSGFVFTTRDGKAQHPNNMKRKLELLCRRAGIRYLPPHSLRHTFVSLLIHQGRPVHQISRLVGHKNMVVTQQVYAHWLKGDLEAVSLNL